VQRRRSPLGEHHRDRMVGKVVSTPEDSRDDIPVEFVAEALQEMKRRGLCVDDVLEGANIRAELLNDRGNSVSPTQFGRLWHLVSTELHDEFFGLDPRGMPLGSFTLMCHAVLHSSTLETALLRSLRFFGILLSDFDGQLSRNGSLVEVTIHEEGPPRSAFAYGVILVLLLGLICWLIDTRIAIQRVDFRCLPPTNPDRYRRLFHDNLNFDQPATRICFDASYMAHQPKRTEAQMRRFLRDAPDGLLVRYRSRDSLSARIWRELRATPPEDWPSFEALAAKLFTTPSTLRRRLEEEGNSYQRIKDEVRRERATRHLKLGVKSNADIALELGFGDPSTFYRAFRKWTGRRPNDFRPARRKDL
jgi:AraC-like DNA-binding protein